jgi:hypothetical protein
METVTDDKSEFGGWLVKNFDPKEPLAAINIGFGPLSIWAFFEPGVPLRFETFQVVDCSV